MNPKKRKKLYRLELAEEKTVVPTAEVVEIKAETKVEVIQPVVEVAKPVVVTEVPEPTSSILKKKKVVNDPV